MPARSKVRSGSLTMILVETTDKPKGIPLGLVENFQVNQPHRVESHTGVGALSPEEIVYHGTGAVTVSWGTVQTIPAETYQALGILPQHRKLAFHEPVNIVAQDVERGETLYRISDALPESFSANIGAQTSLRNNCSFMGKILEHAAELND